MFLAGPPLVKMATGEESDDESLGGAEMHARHSGLADYLAVDEHDAIRIGRQIVGRLNWRKQGPTPAARRRRRRCYDAEDLLGIVPTDLKMPVRPARGDRADRRRLATSTSSSRSTARRWSPAGRRLHGYPVGILANARGVLFSEEAQKAAQFIQLANQADTPLLFLQNTTGYMVGKEYEQGGIIKHGAQMINAVSNSTRPAPDRDDGRVLRRRQLRHVRARLRPAVPVHLAAAQVGGDGAGAARRRAVDRRAGRRPRPAAQAYDEAGDAQMRDLVEAQIEERVAGAVPVRACSTTTASSTRATPAPCSASRCRRSTPRPSRAPTGFGVFRL